MRASLEGRMLLCLHAGMPTLVFLTKVDQCHSELATEVPRLINASERLRSLIRVSSNG